MKEVPKGHNQNKVPLSQRGLDWYKKHNQEKEEHKHIGAILTEEQWLYCVKLGGGNLSSGIRLCILDHIKSKPE